MASVSERGGKWTVRWRNRGSPERYRETFRSEREALRRKVEVEDALDRCGRCEPRRAGGPTPLALILADYVADSARRHAAGTNHRYAQHLELFRRWVGPGGVDRLSWRLLSDYHAHLLNPATGRHLHRRGANTVHKHLQAIELVWRWAWQRQARGDYSGVPQPDSLELRRELPQRKPAPTWGQMDAAIAAARGWQRDLYVVLRCTGLRVGQALGLRWEDLRLDGDVPSLHVRPELGKTRQERRGRWVPIAAVLAEELRTWTRDGELVIRCPRRRREARARDAQRAWTRAGVDGAVWAGCAHHAFRAGFQSELKRAGADDEAVEVLVGHGLGIRDRYLDPDALPLVEAVALVPPMDPYRTQPGRWLTVVEGVA